MTIPRDCDGDQADDTPDPPDCHPDQIISLAPAPAVWLGRTLTTEYALALISELDDLRSALARALSGDVVAMRHIRQYTDAAGRTGVHGYVVTDASMV